MIRSNTSKFDVDLRFGQDGEEWLILLAKHKKLEIKRDRSWAETGNLYFEFESYGKPSGFAATEADYFAYILSGKDGEARTVYIWEIESLRYNLRRIVKEHKVKLTTGGDDRKTRGVILPISLVFELNQARQS